MSFDGKCMTLKKWNIYRGDPGKIEALAKELGVSGEFAGILWNREIRSKAAAEAFLYPEEKQPFYDPFLMKDMEQGVARILAAVQGREKITVYGDYDVDGITATALLAHTLELLGGDVDYYIPDRQREGYGFNIPALQSLAERGTKLVVSVDCGIASLEETAALRGKMDLVITDHHLPGTSLPDALAVIDPHREDCSYPDKNLAGVGVAFKLCQALWRSLRDEEFMGDLEFVALGTIADIVPLVGENRKLVKLGLERMEHTEKPGLCSLIEVASLAGKEIGSGQVGFLLAPRLNAAGRVGSAGDGVKLLLAKDRETADPIAAFLDESNLRRQEIERELLALAEEKIRGMDLSKVHSIVLDGEGWHPGVIGIVASRLVDRYYLPTVIISRQGETGKGSCRSIKGLHMYDALCACESRLLGFGGHSQAAGLTLSVDSIGEFRRMFDEYAAKTLKEEDYVPSIHIEAEMDPRDMSLEFAEKLSLLEPYGMGNPKPVFACRGVRGKCAKAIGREGQNLAFEVGGKEHGMTAISWNRSAYVHVVNAEAIDMVYSPKVNVWQGKRSVELILQEWGPSEDEKIFPHRDMLAKIYSFLKGMREREGRIPADDCLLTFLFSKHYGHISLYSMKMGMRIFRELGLMREDPENDRYLLPKPRGKMDLMESPSYREHEEGRTRRNA